MKKALIGNGGHAKEVMVQMGETIDRFVEDSFYIEEENVFKLSDFNPEKYEVMIAISNNDVRKRISMCLPNQTKYFSFVHPTSIIYSNSIGEGTFIGAYCIVTHNVKMGHHVLLNRANHVGHDCHLGDFVSLMPGSIISGNCKIGNNVFFGTNSSVREKTNICDHVNIGMGSAVIKDIKEPGVYVGVPSKKIK